MQDWPIWQKHFRDKVPLKIQDIAFCNLVRCRTMDKKVPSPYHVQTCVANQFERWLDALTPKFVVFIGKWVHDQGKEAVSSRGIPCGFNNCDRSLTEAERQEDRQRVASLVQQHAFADE